MINYIPPINYLRGADKHRNMSSTLAINKIPFLDLSRQYATLKDEIMQVTEEVLDSITFSGGPHVEDFEKNFAAYCGTQHSVAVSSGTSAIHLAIRALGIGKGDEIIVPANTYIASVWGAVYEGATPVFVDCTPNGWNIDTSAIEAKITPNTKAIMSVHLYGMPCDMATIKSIAQKHNLKVIEDASHAHGAKLNEQRVGLFGDAGCFSFYPGKNLGAYGEAGGITTNSDEVAAQARIMRNQGTEDKYHHITTGFNARIDTLQAAILDVKLKYLDDWNERRRAIAARYQLEITNPKIKWQATQENSEPVYHLFVVTADDRDKFMAYMNQHNIYPGMHYPAPCHMQQALKYLGYKHGDFPNSEYLSQHCVSLPMFAELTDVEISYVIEKINQY